MRPPRHSPQPDAEPAPRSGQPCVRQSHHAPSDHRAQRINGRTRRTSAGFGARHACDPETVVPVPMRQPDYRHAVFSVMKRMLLTSGKTSENTQGPSTCRRYRWLHQFLESFLRLHQKRHPKLRPKQMWPFSGERFPLPPKTFVWVDGGTGGV